MIKFLSFLVIFSFSVMAISEDLNFTIAPGKYHRGGIAKAQVLSTDTAKNTMRVQLDYQVYKRSLVPVPAEFLIGSTVEELPLEFSDERGYLELEKIKKMDLPEATLIYLGRVSVKNRTNGHHVRIKAKNGKSDTDVYYHPHLPGLGWGAVQIFIHTKIPLLENYNVLATLNE